MSNKRFYLLSCNLTESKPLIWYTLLREGYAVKNIRYLINTNKQKFQGGKSLRDYLPQ